MAHAARLPLVALAIVAAGCGSSSSTPHSTAALQETTAKKGCVTAGRHVSFPMLDRTRRSTINAQTNLGTFAFALDVKDSPCTTSSFAWLARRHFFDGLTFHRIAPDFVIQGGDPNGNGTGGPGYSVADRPPADADYRRGVVAMAKTSAEPPGTSGSQFFVVTGADANLPPDYALLGRVTRGLDVVERIGRLGNAQEQPTRRVVIQRMTVSP